VCFPHSASPSLPRKDGLPSTASSAAPPWIASRAPPPPTQSLAPIDAWVVQFLLQMLHSALGHLLGIAPWQTVMQPPRDGAHLLLVRRLIQVSLAMRLSGANQS